MWTIAIVTRSHTCAGLPLSLWDAVLVILTGISDVLIVYSIGHTHVAHLQSHPCNMVLLSFKKVFFMYVGLALVVKVPL